MPAYNPPPQVLFSPVTNYYQGKPIRLQQEMQQKELDSYDKRLELEERMVAARENQVKQAREQFEHTVGLESAQGYAKDLYSRIYAIDEAVTAGEMDEAGALEAAANSFNEYANTLPEEYAAPIHEKLADGLTIDEYRQIKATNAGALEDYGLLDKPDQYTTLSPEEEAALGMDANWSENAVVQRNQEGNLSILNRPTGLTPEDTATRGRRTTDAQQGRNVQDFQDNTIGATSAVVTGTELLDISFNNPEAQGVPGKIMMFGGNLVEGTRSLMNWAGMEFEPDRLAAQGYDTAEEATELQKVGSAAFTYESLDLDALGISGSEATKFQAGIYGIAFAAAVAEQGTRPTDKDIQQFIDQIGGHASNPRAFRDTIFQFMKRQNERLHIIADVKGINDDDRELAFNAWTPRFRAFVLKYATTSGLEAGRDPITGEVQIIHANGRKETF